MDLSLFSRCWKALVEPRNVAATVERNGQSQDEHGKTNAIESTNEQGDEEQEHESRLTTESEYNPQACLFLSLPPEIRNMIYRYTLVEGDIFVDTTVMQPALLQLNRQIRAESIQIYYKGNHFHWTLSA